ncbi:MAG: hypothetical protein JSU72_04800 [Deltaproteobacteria bacterium]|nr:MAG: hypothetical protein JSU72_04800 [Deltaproteobacteria bacterium]
MIEYLSQRYQRVVEIGIGSYPKVALALKARGLSVVATDIQPQAVGLPVQLDDVTAPRLDLYRDAQVIYAVRPPPELVPALKRLAHRLAINLVVKPLAAEPVDGVLVTRAGSFFYEFPFGEGVKRAEAGSSKRF